MRRYLPHVALAAAAATLCSCSLTPLAEAPPDASVTHRKAEHMVAMRDGTRLHTAVYTPRTCPPGGAPVLLQRTPYGATPYGPDTYPQVAGPSSEFAGEPWIVTYQDVRGRYLSEGEWEEVRPYRPDKRGAEWDESSDAYDTIEWLVKHVPCNNGRVGMWGISYPGFYALAAMIDAHPALRAVSPQAPVTDYYLNDDAYHNGAFMLAHNFSFYVNFPPRGRQPGRPQPAREFDYGTRDGYRFYLDGGSLMEMSRKYGLDRHPYWMMHHEHTTYDAFWKARSIWRHFRDVTPAVLVVGGWFDAEDLSGTLRAFRVLREGSPGTATYLAIGPWTHGGWAGGDGAAAGVRAFGQATATHYRAEIEHRFFARELQGGTVAALPRATVFETGANRWVTADTWPPKATPRQYYFGERSTLASTRPTTRDGHDEYVSDPARPVPLVGYEATGMPRDYMASDQSFAARRSDVVTYRTSVLTEDVTVRGPVGVDLHVSTSGTDADFVVKLLDEPGPGDPQAGMQILVRGEPFRGKFRKSFEVPVAFTPGVPDRIRFDLPDIAHTFRAGHRLVVQVQSSWLPLVDRNPQTFTDIPSARPEQFVKATQRLYRSATRPSHITLPITR